MSASKNLPTKYDPKQTFALAVESDNLQIDEELMKEISDEDFNGYEEEGQALPIAEIRQKANKDKQTGKTVNDAGGFKIYDPVAGDNATPIPDVDGEKGLVLTILGDQSGRIYFPAVGESPTCRSLDGIHGVGDPGGDCMNCPLGQMVHGERSKCKAQKNILVYDHVGGFPYVLRLGPSGLRPYKNFKNFIKRQYPKFPLSLFLVKVTTLFKSEPAEHYVPVFEKIDQNKIENFRMMKELREETKMNMDKTMEVITDPDEDSPSRMNTSDPGGDLPPGVEAVNPKQDGKDDDGLPF